MDDEKSEMTEKSFDSALSPRVVAIKATQSMRAQGKLGHEFSDFDVDAKRNQNAYTMFLRHDNFSLAVKVSRYNTDFSDIEVDSSMYRYS